AGADPYENDRYGKLKLTRGGLARRDRAVFEACDRHRLPLAVVMAGGYAKQIHEIAEINYTTIRTLLETRRTDASVG
ncbi:MAG: histone deacetylase, partial [Planctomycetota bacterium]